MEFSVSHLNSSIAAIFALLLIFYWKSRSKASKNSSPPEAGGAWPIIGHLHLIGGGSRLPHITLAAMADKYGPVFTIRLGVHKALVVNNWELAKELFTTWDVIISSRPKFLAAKHIGYDFAMFGFSPYGTYWRELRKLIAVELFSPRRLGLLQHIRVYETEVSIQELYKYWNEKKDGSGRVLVEMKQWFGDLNLNVILRMVAGKRYFGATVDGDKIEARQCQKVLRDFFHLTGIFIVADNIPYLRWLDIGGYEKKMKETGKEMDKIVEKWLEEHKQKANSGSKQDFMDVILSAIEGTNLQDYDPGTIIKSTCLNLIAGGGDTTTVMLVWAVALLLNNRHVLRKAQEELDIHVGKERQVKESDINKLVYIQSIVKETLRLYPAAFLGGIREFSDDCELAGYHIAKGTKLIVNLWKLHRDPRIWSDPLKFKPERFLTTHKDFDVKGHNFELIPFEAGRRICPGTTFGLQMLHFILANLLHAFEISTPFDEKVDMSASSGLSNMKSTPLDVLLSPRLSPCLY
ncbi:cytochrome P450 CYP82D47-like isoform X2 [Olea europaea var. sylvestris]|uniref:cytochrome P450 CYP82D47-like isoform X2 n=1 Tax=Olea europaea var. sylvestris TaxID=158386 RepID=UPI000C1D8632|nr:cytochrome P450 CYP82D47-like isoform X2 [Olea europaea var. sylvestris]